MAPVAVHGASSNTASTGCSGRQVSASAAKAHIAELEAARPDHVEQSAVDLTVARRSYLALVPKPAAEAWAELVTIAKHMGFDLPEPPPRNTTEPHNKELRTKRKLVLRRSR